jgi:hypothetical protein
MKNELSPPQRERIKRKRSGISLMIIPTPQESPSRARNPFSLRYL